MYVLKMRSLIAYIAAAALIISAAGIYFIISPDTAATSANQSENSIEVPIIMYHSVLENKSKTGQFVITPAQFEDDLKFLADNGYTPVFMQDLIDYVYNGAPLPEKPVVLTFDDGYYNNYTYIYPLLQKYKCKAVISIVGAYTDLYTQTPDQNPGYAHLTWDNVNEMMDSGLVEFQNHSYNLHSLKNGRNGSKKNVGETDKEYEAMLVADLNKLQDEFIEHTGYVPQVYTYPFGSVSEASFDIIKEIGFKSSLSCEGKTNYIKQGDKEGLYMLNRFIRTSAKSVSDILKK